MNYSFNNQKRLITLLVVLLAKPCFSQVKPKENSFGIEISSSILAKAKISRLEGAYNMESDLQPVYSLGLFYKKKIDDNLYFHTGFYVYIAKWKYYVFIPAADLPPGYSVYENAPIIYDKSVWGALGLPLIIERKIHFNKTGTYMLKAGINIRYSGLEVDEVTRTTLTDSNNQPVQIFSASFSGNNYYRPWVTFIAGLAKSFVLKNKNVFSIGLTGDISPTYFFTGQYEITIPNQPMTSGTYKISGTSLGLSVQYVFTGANKKIVKEYQKKAF